MSVADPLWGVAEIGIAIVLITCLCWFNRLLGSFLDLHVLREYASCINLFLYL